MKHHMGGGDGDGDVGGEPGGGGDGGHIYCLSQSAQSVPGEHCG